MQRRRSETQRRLHKTAGQSLSGCAAAPPDLRLRSVGLRCRSTRPTTTFCRVALPLHPTYDHDLSGCAAAPPDLRPRSVGLRCRSTRPTTTFCRVALPLHPTYDYALSDCAAAPPDLRPCTVQRPAESIGGVCHPELAKDLACNNKDFASLRMTGFLCGLSEKR